MESVQRYFLASNLSDRIAFDDMIRQIAESETGFDVNTEARLAFYFELVEELEEGYYVERLDVIVDDVEEARERFRYCFEKYRNQSRKE